jgi:hypothetical protein
MAERQPYKADIFRAKGFTPQYDHPSRVVEKWHLAAQRYIDTLTA